MKHDYIPAGLILFATLLLTCTASPTYAQNDHGFRFVRIQYGDDSGGGGGGRGRWGRRGQMWAHDYPTADYNIHTALERTTTVHVDGNPIVLSLKDPRIFEHPVLYICEPGYWTMDEEEAANLQEYLARGGFLLFDDFRGDYEWSQLYENMQRVLPNVEPRDIPPEHPIWSIYFDIDPVAAPSLVSCPFGVCIDEYRAYFDENGRMIALACYNQDIGDGWEWPDRTFDGGSTISFQMGINFLIYALTH